jgi:hypothetical protein
MFRFRSKTQQNYLALNERHPVHRFKVSRIAAGRQKIKSFHRIDSGIDDFFML